MAQLAIYLFGPPRVAVAGVERYIRRRKGVALLAYLAVTRQPHSRDALSTLFWPEFDQTGARDNLRRTLSELHQTLDNDWLVIDRITVRLRDDTEPWVDLWQFHQLLAACQQHSHAKDQVCSACLPLLQQAAELYHDDFLAGFTLADSPAFDDWQAYTTAEVRTAFAATLARLVDAHMAQRAYPKAIDQARRWVALDPLHEPAQRRLMELYARSNQRAAALRQYEECRQILADELAVSPAPETTALYEQIRAHTIGPDERVSRLAVVIERPHHNLPTQTTTFINRTKEMAEIQRLLLDEPSCRLLNLVGPGGIGKTRLALAAAAQMTDAFPDGVFFVPLAPVSEAADIVPTIAEALRFTLYGSGDLKEQLLGYLRQKHLLLLLDNFEHLLAGTDLLSAILLQAPTVTLLTTARQRLQLQEEWVYEVQGLTVPVDGAPNAATGTVTGELDNYSAVQLFLHRARQTRATFTPLATEMAAIVHICQLVEGMPLAIELAAPWVRTLSCAEIATEIVRNLDFLSTSLRNLPKRHHSLRMVFEQAWERLSQVEQSALMQLSVFRGGCTRDATVAVAGATLPVLSSLVDKVLLRRTNVGRYELHELIRQFAWRKLQSVTETAIREAQRAHADYYLHLLLTEESKLFGVEPRSAKAILRADLDNLHLAWHWACANRQIGLLRAALEPLARFYKMASLPHTAEQIFAAADAQIAAWSQSDKEARHLQGLVGFYRSEALYFVARYAEAAEIANAVYALGLAEGNLVLQAQAQILLGQIAFKQGELDLACQCSIEGYACATKAKNERLLAHAADNLGNILHVRKEQDFGLVHHQQACQIAKAQGDLWALATYLSNLGWMYYDKWEFETALDYFQQALNLQKQINARFDMIETHLRIGQTHHMVSQDDLALEQHMYAASIGEELGLRDNAQAWLAIGKTYSRQGDWANARWWLEKARQLLHELGKQLMLAECTENIGIVLAASGEYHVACAHHKEAMDIYRQLNMSRAANHQQCLLGQVYLKLGNYAQAQSCLEQALDQARADNDRIYLPQILQALSEAAFGRQAFARAQAYCEECIQLLQEMGEQHFFRKTEVTLGAKILQAQLTYVQGNHQQATDQLATMIAATENPSEQAALHYAHWQLDRNPEQGRKAFALYQQLYARKSYFNYRQRIDELSVGAKVSVSIISSSSPAG